MPGMIGETALVEKEIRGSHHPGTIRARGESWLAIPLDPEATIPAGTDVVVADIERGLLIVYPADIASAWFACAAFSEAAISLLYFL